MKGSLESFPDDGLCFPVIREPIAPPSERSIDEIDAWIEHDFTCFFDRERYSEEKRKLSVNERFVLK
jgi:hypothetical protein